MNYKDTLLMPKTDFPMRGGLPNKDHKFKKCGIMMSNIAKR